MCVNRLKSSVGRKAVMAFTGLALFLFVIVHMLGNLQIFLGPDAINDYALHLRELAPLVWAARAVLLLIFVTHIAVSLSLAVENRRARPVAYAYKDTVEASFASRTMVVSGIIIFLFVVYHLLHFTFGLTHPQFFHLLDARGRIDVYSMVVLSFRDAKVSAAYIAAMFVLCAHLSHGIQSLFQSVGWNNENLKSRLSLVSFLLAAALFIGNVSIPLAAMTGLLKLPPGAA